jgi:hypothetical protein
MTKIIRTIDTIDFDRDKTENIAQHEDVLVGWRGKWVKVDLSHDNFTQLDAMLGNIMKIGDPVEDKKSGQARTPSGRKSIAHGGRRSKSYYEGLVRWCNEYDIRKKNGSGRMAYESHVEGRNDYPEWLITDYDRYVETGEMPEYVRAA